MKTQQVQRATDTLSVLRKQPLAFVFRSMDMICFEFGEIISKQVFGRDETGKATLIEEKAGKYALHVQCYFRLTCGDIIICAKSDVVQPSSEQLNDPDFQEDTFDWSPDGSNRFDEIAAQYFRDPLDYIVSNITVNKFGDLMISFDNGFLLEIFVDVSGAEECWRFFESGTDRHLIINGEGIDDDNINELYAD